MQRLLKTMLALFALGIFTFSAVVCCCVGRMVQAQAAVKADHACCHADQSGPGKDKKACDDCSHKGLIAEAAPLAIDIASPTVLVHADQGFDFYAPAPRAGELAPVHGMTGPPGFAAAIPLYLQFRVLRL